VSAAAPDTIATRLVQLAANCAGQPALEWFSDFNNSTFWSWRQLHQRACAFAAQITALAPPASQVMLALPQGLDFVGALFGCYYAGCTPVPVYPPDSAKSLPRFLRIVTDSNAAAIVTTPAIAAKFVDHLPRVESDPAIIDATAVAGADDFAPRSPSADQLALLQYTSGTTSEPKGVMISHRNLIANESAMSRVLPQGAAPHIVSWLPFYHDMGLMGGLLFPVFNGIPATLLSPATFLRNPATWLRLISDRRATMSTAPNFAYELCSRVISDDVIAGLDLSSWRTAICGAEVVRRHTAEKFIERFSAAGFRAESFMAAYGLAESTLFVCADTAAVAPVFAASSTVDSEERAATSHVSCGPCVTTDVRIVDPQHRRSLADGGIGEIWIKSASVGGGYWRQPELSAAVFDAVIHDSGERGFLRTGDLGFMRAGNLHVTGRIKELVILRGRNYAPQDIELVARTAAPAAAVGQCVAFAIDKDGSEALVVALEFNRRKAPTVPLSHVLADVRLALRGALSIDAEDIVLVRQNSLPRTSSGKLQRSSARTQYLSQQLERLTETTPETVAESS